MEAIVRFSCVSGVLVAVCWAAFFISGTQGVRCNAKSTSITIESEGGTVYSPGYPQLYEASDSCSWILIAKPAQVVELQVTDMDLERKTASQCADYLVAYDGTSAFAQAEIRKLCGSEKLVLRSTGRQMLLQFFSDGQGARRGFAVNYYSTPPYNAGCEQGQQTRLTVGTTTPVFLHIPVSSYQDYAQCRWRLEAADARHRLRIETVSKSGTWLTCTDGYLSVREMNATATSPELVRWCDTAESPFSLLYSETNIVLVELKISSIISSISDLSLIFEVTAWNPTVSTCDRNNRPVVEYRGGAPLFFPFPFVSTLSGQGCPVEIHKASGGGLRVDVITVDGVLAKYECQHYLGAVKFYENSLIFQGREPTSIVNITEEKRLSAECWRSGTAAKGPVFRTAGGSAAVTQGNSVITTIRVVNLVEKSHVCSEFVELTGETTERDRIQTLTMPAAESVIESFAPYSLCQVLFKANREGDHPMVKFDIDFSESNGCTLGEDGLYVYDGNSSTSSPIFEYCLKEKTTRYVIGPGRQMLVRFITDGDHNRGSLKLSYFSVAGREPEKRPCFGDVDNVQTWEATSEWASLQSPNYRDFYYPNENCQHRITTDRRGEVVHVRVLDTFFGAANTCDDRLMFYDGFNQHIGSIIQTVCGGARTPIAIESRGQDLFIMFMADERNSQGGWRLEYRSGINSSEEAEESSSVNTPAMVLGIVLGIIILILIIVIIVIIMRRKNKDSTDM